MKQLLIDNRFLIKAEIHTVTDLSKNREARLEPRLIKLLLMLAYSPGQVVTREQIIRDIWNDYGGGEDALNLAISSLRKILDDEEKQKIRTVPKKGYILAADVTAAEPPRPRRSFTINAMPVPARRIGLGSFIIIVIVAFLIVYGRSTSRNAYEPQQAPVDEIKDTIYQYQEMKKQ